MERSRVSLISALLGLAAALGAVPAAAAEPSPAGKGADTAKDAASADDDLEGDAGPARPAAPDERTGHLYYGVTGTAVGPAGAMGPATPSTSLSPVGFGWGAYLGVGVGRHATVQIFGDRTSFLSPGTCSERCGGYAYSAGLGLTYHLAQGIAFDPWGSFGVAYRYSSFDIVDPNNPARTATRLTQVYQGIDVARIAFGGDFYPTSFFGFGPYLEADFGTNFRWPKPTQTLPPDVGNGPRTYALFSVGIRISFDPMRKPVRPAAVQDARGETAPLY